jgi:hypothetical protein
MNLIKQLSIVFLLTLTSLQLWSQDKCSSYFPFQEETVLGYSYFNGKGKLTSKSVQTVKTVRSEADGSITATMEMTNQDKKGKEISSGSYEVACVDNNLVMKVSEIMAPNMKSSLNNMEIDISGDDFRLPSNLKKGQELPNTHTEIKAGTNGISIITMAIDHTNRIVEDIEKITTEAGTFECVKFSYDVAMNMLISKNYHVTTWYNEDAGLVRQETYNKKGQLETKTELTGYVKGK